MKRKVNSHKYLAASRVCSAQCAWQLSCCRVHALADEQLTVIINTWKRLDLLQAAVKHYSQCSTVRRVHVNWAESATPPDLSAWICCNAHVTLCHTWSVTQRHFAQHALPPHTRCAHHSLYGLVAMYAKCNGAVDLQNVFCSNQAAVWTVSCFLHSVNAQGTDKPAGLAVAAQTLSRRLVQISKARQCSTSTMTSPHRVKHWRARCRRAATALHGLPQLPALWGCLLPAQNVVCWQFCVFWHMFASNS